MKTAQELARHETATLTLNTYGRAKEERCRAVVESVGKVVFSDYLNPKIDNSGHEDYTKLTQGLGNLDFSKIITPDVAGGYNEEKLVRKRGLEPP